VVIFGCHAGSINQRSIVKTFIFFKSKNIRSIFFVSLRFRFIFRRVNSKFAQMICLLRRPGDIFLITISNELKMCCECIKI